ncbi:MAG: M23 family metallopeptidase [Candidatus Uhrbacteria bacterium]|nr:M23 family metallopeptidase [Candidatus Uhrbacteria bacterium]
MKIIALFFLLTVLGAGCISRAAPEVGTTTGPTVSVTQSQVVLPLDGGIAGYNPTYKRFGEYFSDRFHGYHTGEDSEVAPEDLGPGEVQLIPVRAVADGQVIFSSRVSGYGGVIVLRHELDGKVISSLYGHIAIASSNLKVGDQVKRGQFLANLGEARSRDTDGERQHLHFGLWEGSTVKLAGYVKTSKELDGWLNPFDFFVKYGALSINRDMWIVSNNFFHAPQLATPFVHLSFSIPDGWDIEYLTSLQALNVYDASGNGSARERSQIFIRYFDAKDFLTLSTVNIHSTKNLTIGERIYTARRYEIEKKTGVPNFPDQPLWRNSRHKVTDFRAKDGFTRYFVVAANPKLDAATYEKILQSMFVTEK